MYYTCSRHYEVDSVTHVKRRRWAPDADLNVGIEDVVINKKAMEGIHNDHPYVSDVLGIDKEDDNSDLAVDLQLGTDTFVIDSKNIGCREETFEDEQQTENLVHSQLTADSTDIDLSSKPSQSSESYVASNESQESMLESEFGMLCYIFLNIFHETFPNINV